jgi:hypothetical protein
VLQGYPTPGLCALQQFRTILPPISSASAMISVVDSRGVNTCGHSIRKIAGKNNRTVESGDRTGGVLDSGWLLSGTAGRRVFSTQTVFKEGRGAFTGA